MKAKNYSGTKVYKTVELGPDIRNTYWQVKWYDAFGVEHILSFKFRDKENAITVAITIAKDLGGEYLGLDREDLVVLEYKDNK